MPEIYGLTGWSHPGGTLCSPGVNLMAATRPDHLLLCHAVNCGTGGKQVLRCGSLRSLQHQDDEAARLPKNRPRTSHSFGKNR